MYHAACKVEFQPFKRSYSLLTFSTFYKNNSVYANQNLLRKWIIYSPVTDGKSYTLIKFGEIWVG